MSHHTAVTVARREGVALVALNEPASLNALSPAIKAALTDIVPALLADPEVRAIVLTGQGRAFCAGGDIRGMDERSPNAVRARMGAVHVWLGPLLRAEKPVVTAVNGVAAGAGLSLALAGDLVCASATARFKAGFPGLGAVPDLGLASTLPRAIGTLRAKDMLLTNREVGAEEALRIGLCSRLFEPDALVEGAMDLAADLARGPTVSFGLAKALLQRAYEPSLDRFLAEESSAQVVAFGSEDFAEGVAAFRGKRPARFEGR